MVWAHLYRYHARAHTHCKCKKKIMVLVHRSACVHRSMCVCACVHFVLSLATAHFPLLRSPAHKSLQKSKLRGQVPGYCLHIPCVPGRKPPFPHSPRPPNSRVQQVAHNRELLWCLALSQKPVQETGYQNKWVIVLLH